MKRMLIWILASLPFLLLTLRTWSYPFGLTAGDYAHYLLHAQALATGRDYGDIGYIYTRLSPWIGPPVQPPGLPLTLAPLLALFGRNMLPIQILMVASAAAFLALSGRYVARRHGLAIGAASVLLVGTALQAMNATNNILSDLGFCTMVWGVITVADRPGGWSWRRAAGVAVLTAVAIAYRAAGVSLLLAIPAYLLVTFRRRALVPALAAGGVMALVLLALSSATNVFVDLFASPVEIAGRALTNALDYRFGVFEALLYPFPSPRANDAYHLAALPPLALGAVLWVRAAARSFLASFVAAYLVMLLVVPVRETRYLWPLLPVLAMWLALGLRQLALIALRLVRRGPTDPGLLARRSGVIAAGAIALICWSAALLDALAPRPESFPDHPDVSALFGVVHGMGTGEEARLAFVNPRVLTWHTGVAAMGPIDAPPDTVLAELRAKRISHVVVGDLGTAPAPDVAMRRVVDAAPGCFVEIYRNPSFTLYRFLGAGSPSADPGSGGGASGGDPRAESAGFCRLDASANPVARVEERWHRTDGTRRGVDTRCCPGATVSRDTGARPLSRPSAFAA